MEWEVEYTDQFEDWWLTLSEQEQENLLACRWHHWLAALAEYPSSLVHGDPHTGNVVPTLEGFALFDWSDASVAPPWMDLLDVLFEEDRAIGEQLIDAHAQALGIRLPWARIAPVLGAYHALSYRAILNAIEPSVRHEHGDMVATILRKAVDFTGKS